MLCNKLRSVSILSAVLVFPRTPESRDIVSIHQELLRLWTCWSSKHGPSIGLFLPTCVWPLPATLQVASAEPIFHYRNLHRPCFKLVRGVQEFHSWGHISRCLRSRLRRGLNNQTSSPAYPDISISNISTVWYATRPYSNYLGAYVRGFRADARPDSQLRFQT